MNRLKEKWGIKSNFELIIIFFVFSVTGSLSVYVRSFIFAFLGIGKDFPWYLLVPIYILTIVPTYYILLLAVGWLFGKFQFFLAFEKKSLGRIFIRK